jgi:outer membrane biosynthesis protein TonB
VPTPEPVKAAEPTPAPEKPAEPAPAPVDVAALPAQTTPDPVAEAITEAAPAEPQFAALPSAGPVPEKRPEPVKAAAKPDSQENASSKESDFNADQVAALLNKQDAAGGGAKRSTETASLGGERTTRGNTLSQSEMDALRGQIQKYWNIIPGMADGGDVRVTVKMRLDPAGNIIGEPDVSASGGSAGTRGTLSGSARRAVLRAQPYQLPKEKYDSWAEVIVNFDPSQMF